MSYNGDNPADTEYISAAPAEIRANQEQLRTGQIVDAKGAAGLIPSNNTGQIPVSNGTVCVNLNADMVDGHHASEFATADHVHSVATDNAGGFESAADKAKLDGIASGAEVNQNTFANVAVGSNTIQADSKQDTLTVVAGANINIVADTTNDKLTIAVTGCVLNSGGAISGALNLANNIQINGVDTAGTAYNLVFRDANNNSSLGSPAYPTVINSSVQPTWSNGTATKTLATTDGTVANATNAVAATKATQDASGNVITDTYAPLASAVPTGTGQEYYGDTAPAGYLLCDGSAVSRTTYANLFAVLGTKFGTGNGTTTFNLPDRRHRVGVGLDSTDSDFATLGNTGGEKTHTLTTAEMPNHGHNAWTDSQGSHVHTVYGYKNEQRDGPGVAGGGDALTAQPSTGAAGTHGHNVGIGTTGGNAAHNNMPPYLVINYIIKY